MKLIRQMRGAPAILKKCWENEENCASITTSIRMGVEKNVFTGMATLPVKGDEILMAPVVAGG
jgi:hypothetical protein